MSRSLSLMAGVNGTLLITVGALGFFLPFSSAGVSLAMLPLVLLAPIDWRQSARGVRVWREPVMAVGLVLLAYMAVHTIVTSGLERTAWHAVNRYQELLLAPILLALLQSETRRAVFFRCLMAGAFALAAVHWVALLAPQLKVLLESRRISAGFSLAVCSYLLAISALGRPNPWPRRALAGFLALTVIFAVDGRTGYVVLLVLISCLAWVHSPMPWRWIAAGAVPLAILAVTAASPAVQGRFHETLAALDASDANAPVTASTLRLELMRNTADLVRRHFMIGAGYANFAAAYEQARQARLAAAPAGSPHVPPVRANPHNEYVMQLVGGGIVSIALFVAWLGLAIFRGVLTAGPPGAMLVGVGLAFATGCLFNSMLMDFVEGHLYAGLLAWLLAQAPAGHIRLQDKDVVSAA